MTKVTSRKTPNWKHLFVIITDMLRLGYSPEIDKTSTRTDKNPLGRAI